MIYIYVILQRKKDFINFMRLRDFWLNIYIIFPGNLVDSKAVIREFHEVHLNGKKYTEMETYT